MPNRSYSIFGDSIEFQFESEQLKSILEPEISCYGETQRDPNLTITLSHTPSKKTDPPLSKNPKIHTEFATGFKQSHKQCSVYWEFGEQPRIDLQLHEFAPLKRLAYRLNHMQYTTRSEMIGQILHEAVLIPRILLSDHHAVIHASSIISPRSNKPILIGGTGGTGKTSLMLNACLRHQWKFAADDISILSTEGKLYPNFSYPKIYGYNLDAFPELNQGRQGKRGLLDRLHWKLHSLRGADKVRRREDPRKLFDVNLPDTIDPPSDYIILFRNDCSETSIEKIDPEISAKASSEIVQSEYTAFLKHISWSRSNRLLLGLNPNDEALKINWEERTLHALRKTRCWKMNIPLNISHHDFLESSWPLIENLSTSTTD